MLGVLSLTACRPSGETGGASDVNVVNGGAITGRDRAMAKSVFHLHVYDASLNTIEKSCTAAAISDRAVLVAAHCLPRGENILPRLKIAGKDARVQQIISAESLHEATVLSERDAAMDVGAIVFNSASPIFLTEEIATIAPLSEATGSPVKVIGFGATELDALKNPTSATGSGQAAIGGQKILSADGSTYEMRATEQDLSNPNSGVAIAAPGDSGAPLFNHDGQLIGLMVGLSYYKGGTALDLSQDLAQVSTDADAADAYGNKAVDLKSPTSQRIIQIALGQTTGSISYELQVDSPTPFLAICRRDDDSRDGRGFGNGGSGDRGGRRGRDRFNSRDLTDLLDRFGGANRNGSGGNSGNSTGRGNSGSSRSGNSSGSGNSSLSDQDIRNILNDL